MAYTPSDIYRVIEPFELTQGFGGNAASYARFGLKGHNGWDYRTKIKEEIKLANGRRLSATPNGQRSLLAAWFFQLYKIGYDPGGFGNYFEVLVQLKSLWKITYAHCTSIKNLKSFGESEVMAVSGSTGNSTGDHVHETVKRIEIVGGTHKVLDYNNGYFGAVNNQEFYNELREWKKTHNNIPAPLPAEGNTMDMYNGFDLDNKGSMRVAVDSHIRVVNRDVIPQSEVTEQLKQLREQLTKEKEEAVNQAFKNGEAAGKASIPVPAPTPGNGSQIDTSGFVQDGLRTEETIGNTKVIKNYRPQ